MENADIFYRLQRFDLLRIWLSKIADTYDKNYKLIDKYLKKKNSPAVNAAVIALIKSRRKDLLPWLGRKLIVTGDLNLRQSILKYFRYTGDAGALKYLLKFRVMNSGKMNNEERRLLYLAIGSLGKWPEERLLLGLLAKMKKASGLRSRLLRDSLVYAVCECGGLPTLRFFKKHTKKHGFLYAVRQKTADALIKMKYADPGPFLFYLESSGDKGIHKSVMNVLAKRKVPGGSEFLIKTYEKYKKSGGSMYALARAAEKQEYRKVKQIFIDLLKRNDIGFNTASVAFLVLKREKDNSSEKIVLNRISKEKNLQIVSLMINYLGEIKSVKSQNVLKTFLKHSAPGIRFLASESLSRITGRKYKFEGFSN